MRNSTPEYFNVFAGSFVVMQDYETISRTLSNRPTSYF
jgi:hypothetical protein